MVKPGDKQGRIILAENNIPYTPENLKKLEQLNPGINFSKDLRVNTTIPVKIPLQ